MEIVDLRQIRIAGLLEQAYCDLYLSCFPDPDEQEDLDQYQTRLYGSPQQPPQPITHILVAGDELQDPARRVVSGLLIFELYRDSSCGLLTYLAVAPPARRTGLGRRLLQRARETLLLECPRLRALFGETHDPRLVDPATDSMSPSDRIEALKRLGAHLIPIRYVQPSLRQANGRSEKLLLLAFPLREGLAPSLSQRTLLTFLSEFYRALGVAVPAQDRDYQQMQADTLQASTAGVQSETLQIAQDLKLTLTPVLGEGNYLSIRVDGSDDERWAPQIHNDSPIRIGFPQIPVYGVALHFVFSEYRPQHPSPFDEPSSPEFQSFEDDLVSYAFADRGLFRSQAVRLTDADYGMPALLRIPNPVVYRAEGQKKEIRIGEAPSPGESATGFRERRVKIRASFTEFSTGMIVLHLVINQDDTVPLSETALNEHDLVALSQFWHRRARASGSAGQITAGEFRETALPDAIRFRFAHAGPLQDVTLSGVLTYLKHRGSHPSLRRAFNLVDSERALLPQAGTVHVLCAPSEDEPPSTRRGLSVHGGLFARLESYQCQQHSDAESARQEVGRFATAQAPNLDLDRLDRECVALQGILCGLLDHWDIAADELNDVFASPVACEGRTFDDFHKGTLLCFSDDRRFNENPANAKIGISPYLLLPQALLLHNERLLRDAADAAARVISDRDGVSEENLRHTELLMRAALQRDWIPNLFHYRTERGLYDDGESARGLTTWKASLLEALKEIDGLLEEKEAATANFINWTIGFIGFSLAVAQVGSGWESLTRAILRVMGESPDSAESSDTSVLSWMMAAFGTTAFGLVFVMITLYWILFKTDLSQRYRQMINRWHQSQRRPQ